MLYYCCLEDKIKRGQMLRFYKLNKRQADILTEVLDNLHKDLSLSEEDRHSFEMAMWRLNLESNSNHLISFFDREAHILLEHLTEYPKPSTSLQSLLAYIERRMEEKN